MNINELHNTAVKLKKLLEKHSLTNTQAKDVLKSSNELLTKAINKEIKEPIPRGWFHIYLEPGYDLAEINELSQTASEFSILLEGWNSLATFREELNESQNIARQKENEFGNDYKNKNS